MSQHDAHDIGDQNRPNRVSAGESRTDAGPRADDEPSADCGPTANDDASFDPEAEGKAEAKRLLQAADGDTERARAEAALARKREEVERLDRQLTDAKQRRQQTRERIEALEYTVERVEDAADDQLVVQRLEGGVSLSVPADERESVCEDLSERKQRLEQRLDDIEGQIEAAERGLQKGRIAFNHLQNHKDLVSDQ